MPQLILCCRHSTKGKNRSVLRHHFTVSRHCRKEIAAGEDVTNADKPFKLQSMFDHKISEKKSSSKQVREYSN